MPKQTTKVLLLDNMIVPYIDQLNSLTDPQIEISIDEETNDYQILISGRLKEAPLKHNPGLIAAIIPWAGIPDSYYELLSQPAYRHIAVHNCHYHAAIVAEYAFGMLLTLAKDIIRKDRRLRQGDWRPRYGPSRALMLAGRTALVMGYGAIGSEIGRLCHALGMRVIGTRRHLDGPQKVEPATLYPAGDLNKLLPECDVLINALPLTPQTDGLIGAAEINRLKPSALIVNIGRAKTFDEAALYDALAEQRIHGAALDVWYRYPSDELGRAATFPASYPFHQLDNVLMSPHNSAALRDSQHLTYRVESLAEMLNAFVREGALPNRVDLDRGY